MVVPARVQRLGWVAALLTVELCLAPPAHASPTKGEVMEVDKRSQFHAVQINDTAGALFVGGTTKDALSGDAGAFVNQNCVIARYPIETDGTLPAIPSAVWYAPDVASGETLGADYAACVVTALGLSSSHVFGVGYTELNDIDGAGAGTRFQNYPPSGGVDGFVVKLGIADLSFVASVQVGAVKNKWEPADVVLSGTDVYVVGTYKGGDTATTIFNTTNTGDKLGVVIRYGPSLAQTDYVVKEVSSKNVYYHGATQYGADIYTTGEQDGLYLFAKYDLATLTEAVYSTSGLSSTAGYNIAAGVSQGTAYVYIVGSTSSTFQGYTNAGGDDVFVAKYTTAGAVVYERLLEGAGSGSDMGNAIAVLSGTVYGAGAVLNSGESAASGAIWSFVDDDTSVQTATLGFQTSKTQWGSSSGSGGGKGGGSSSNYGSGIVMEALAVSETTGLVVVGHSTCGIKTTSASTAADDYVSVVVKVAVCSAGTLSATSSNDDTLATCSALTAANTYTTAPGLQAQTCAAGYVPNSAQSACEACALSHYAAAGNATCTPCPAGTMATAGALTSAADCVSCSAGYYSSSAASTACSACASGTFAENPGSVTCVKCPGGTSSSEASPICTSCVRGQYSTEGSSSCKNCDVGYYNDKLRASSCKLCPYSGTTSSTGASDVSDCECPVDTYGDVSEKIECLECPKKATCSGRRTPRTDEGFYIDSSDLGFVYECVPEAACPGGFSECSTGYSGRACTSCATGYYRKNGWCVECPDTGTMSIILAVVIGLVALTIIVLMLCCFMFVRRLRCMRDLWDKVRNTFPGIGRMMGMQFTFFQIAGTILSLGLDFSFPLQTFYLELLNFMALDAASVTNTECSAGGVPYAFKYHARVLSPMFILIFVLVSVTGIILSHMTVIMCYRRRPRPPRKRLSLQRRMRDIIAGNLFNMATGLLALLNIMYYFLHITTIEPLRCRQISAGNYVMVTRPDISCFVAGGEWSPTIGTCTLFFFVYSLGIPMLFALVCCRYRNRRFRDKSFIPQLFRFLFDKYQDEYYFYEVIILGRKFLMGAVLLMSFSGVYDQATALFCVLFFAVVFHGVMTPFQNKWDDWLELTSLIVLVLVSIMSIMISTGKLSDMVDTFLEALISVLMFGQMACALMLLYLRIRNDVKTAAVKARSRKDSPGSSDSGADSDGQEARIGQVTITNEGHVPLEPNPFEPEKAQRAGDAGPPTMPEGEQLAAILNMYNIAAAEAKALRKLSGVPEEEALFHGACLYCEKPNSANVGCPGCSTVWYCSRRCLDGDRIAGHTRLVCQWAMDKQMASLMSDMAPKVEQEEPTGATVLPQSVGGFEEGSETYSEVLPDKPDFLNTDRFDADGPRRIDEGLQHYSAHQRRATKMLNTELAFWRTVRPRQEPSVDKSSVTATGEPGPESSAADANEYAEEGVVDKGWL